MIIRMLEDGLVKIAGEHAASVQGLTQIRDELECAAGFTDLTSIKRHMAKCLSEVRAEIDREKAASKALIEKLQVAVEHSREPRETLPTTRVDLSPEQSQEDELGRVMQAAIDKGTRHYALLMKVNRIGPIIARFGKAAGDRMLARFQKHVETQLFTEPDDRLLHLTEQVIVAILERPATLEQVRASANKILAIRIDETSQIGARSVLIPISAAWSIFGMTTIDAAQRQIQTFVASHGCRDFA